MGGIRTDTSDWYTSYYRDKGETRNDLLQNPEVLFQQLAYQAAVIRALRDAHLDRRSAKVLDVGSGTGSGVGFALQLEFLPENLHGIDLLEERVAVARRRYPGVNFVCDDASRMPFEAGAFDLVMESTMFVQITDESLAVNIAREMLRVTKPGGHILLIDWRYGKPRNPQYSAVSPKRVRSLFPRCLVVSERNGALVPPVGRLLSKYASWAYFPIQALLPFLVGLKATLLRTPS